MKTGSDNFRFSAIQDVIRFVREQGVEVILYEPFYEESQFEGCKVERSFEKFEKNAAIIIANRFADALADVQHKVYTRDVFNRD